MTDSDWLRDKLVNLKRRAENDLALSLAAVDRDPHGYALASSLHPERIEKRRRDLDEIERALSALKDGSIPPREISGFIDSLENDFAANRVAP